MDNITNNNENSQEKIYTLKEISGILGISYNHLVNKIVKGKLLETVNVGKGKRPEHRVTQKALDNYLTKQSTGGQGTIQDAVAALQKIRNNSLVISYITSPDNPISQEDPLFFSDVIEDIIKRKVIKGKIPVIDLFINSFGGSIDAAYKISRILWHYAERVNTIVPIYAKSAATIICVGSKEVTMMPVSELGPVDPIIENPVTKEQIPAKSVKIFLSYASDKSRLEADKIDPAIVQKLGDKLEPLLAGAYFNAINSSKEYLRILLNEYMFAKTKSSQDIERMVENLTELHSSHAFVIDFTEANDIGLNVRTAIPTEQESIKLLMNFYSQYMNAQGLTKLVGNEFFMIHQNLRR